MQTELLKQPHARLKYFKTKVKMPPMVRKQSGSYMQQAWQTLETSQQDHRSQVP